MPKGSSRQDNFYYQKSQHKPYTRQPIHQTAEESEDLDEEEAKETDSNELYPDLKEELQEIQKLLEIQKDRKLNKFEKKKKSIREFKQSVMSEESDYQKSSSSVFKYAIYFLFSILFALGFVSFLWKPTDETDVMKLVSDMQNNFQHQQSNNFKLLKVALMKVVNPITEPSAPAIFTIVANKGAENTASEFSMYLAKALAPGQFVSINESAQWRSNPEDLKFKIDMEIRSNLEKEILNVVIVDRLNDIPVEAAMIFHGFCDHENAPYKRAVYLFIVHLSKSIPENSPSKYIDAVAMDSLRNIWRTSSDDLVDSLITRITVNVVHIRQP